MAAPSALLPRFAPPGICSQIPGGAFFVVLAALLSGCSGEVTVEIPAFEDIATAAGLHRVHTGGGPDKGYIVEAKGGGSAVLDSDGDGDLDIFWVNGATLQTPSDGAGNALYRNDGDLRFTDTAADVGLLASGWGMGAVSADYDNDGDADLYVTCLQHDWLYRNDGGKFSATQSGVSLDTWSTGAAFGDYDQDGDLDLYVASYVAFDTTAIQRLGTQWKGIPSFVGPLGLQAQSDHLLRNDGGRFTDVSHTSGIDAVDPGYGLGVVFSDVDLDGDPDIYVANDSSPNFLFRNEGGQLVDVALTANVSHGAMGNAQAGMGVAVGDYDGDGADDLFVTNFDDDYNTLYHNDGSGNFEDVSFAAGLAQTALPFVGFGAAFVDFNNDTQLDLFVANGHVYPQIDVSGTNSSYAQQDHLYQGLGNGRFELFQPDGRSPFSPRVSRGAVAADFDDDGDTDLFVTHLNDRPALYRNNLDQRASADANWLGVRLVGTRSNRDGVGARVVLHASSGRQARELRRGSSFLSSEDSRLHFGIGSADVVDSLTIQWPAGGVQRLQVVGVNRYVSVQEPQPGAEP